NDHDGAPLLVGGRGRGFAPGRPVAGCTERPPAGRTDRPPAGRAAAPTHLTGERELPQLHADRRPAHLQDAAEVRLDEHAERMTPEPLREHPAARADPALP